MMSKRSILFAIPFMLLLLIMVNAAAQAGGKLAAHAFNSLSCTKY